MVHKDFSSNILPKLPLILVPQVSELLLSYSFDAKPRVDADRLSLSPRFHAYDVWKSHAYGKDASLSLGVFLSLASFTARPIVNIPPTWSILSHERSTYSGPRPQFGHFLPPLQYLSPPPSQRSAGIIISRVIIAFISLTAISQALWTVSPITPLCSYEHIQAYAYGGVTNPSLHASVCHLWTA